MAGENAMGKSKSVGPYPKGSQSQAKEPEINASRGTWISDVEKRDLVEILENLPCGLAILRSPFGEPGYLNPRIVETLGYCLSSAPSTDELEKRIRRNERERHYSTELWREVVAAGGGVSTFDAVCGDGEVRTFEHRSVVLREDLIIALWIDITERKSKKIQLLESEPRFSALFYESIDPFLLFGGDHLINFNKATQELFGQWNRGRLLGATLSELSATRQRDGSRSEQKAAALFQSVLEKGSLRAEWTLLRSDGQPIHAELSVAVVTVGEKNLFFMVARDITSWKKEQTALLYAKSDLEKKVRERTAELTDANTRLRAEIRARETTERELRDTSEELRRLSEHLHQIGENSRVHVAREVHDQLGQSLAALKIDLAQLRGGQWAASGNLEQQVRGIEFQVSSIMQSVREICKELRPSVFDDFGLPSAIISTLKEFEKKTGICCEAEVDEAMPQQKTDGCLVLFRILQEALSNIRRHAQASQVRVGLKNVRGRLRLDVEDNGVGITASQTVAPDSLGILGIRERVRFRGGKLSIKGRPGKGTRMTVWLPIAKDESPQEMNHKSAAPLHPTVEGVGTA